MSAPFPVQVDGVLHADPASAGPIERGFGVLDTLLLERGVRWFEERHRARLRAACDRFALGTFERFDVAAEIARFAAALGERTALVRTVAARDPRTGAPTLVLDARAPRVAPAEGIELLPVDAAADPLGSWKTTERAARVLHGDHAERAGCFDALLVLPDGSFVETARANVFAVVDGRVATPPLAAGCLPGIVRGLLVESLGDVVERPLAVADLRRAEEVWITSSGLWIAPVRSIRGVADRLPGASGSALVRACATLARRASAYSDRTAGR